VDDALPATLRGFRYLARLLELIPPPTGTGTSGGAFTSFLQCDGLVVQPAGLPNMAGKPPLQLRILALCAQIKAAGTSKSPTRGKSLTHMIPGSFSPLVVSAGGVKALTPYCGTGAWRREISRLLPGGPMIKELKDKGYFEDGV